LGYHAKNSARFSQMLRQSSVVVQWVTDQKLGPAKKITVWFGFLCANHVSATEIHH